MGMITNKDQSMENIAAMFNKTVFISGVTGMDGSLLSEFLLSKGYKVIGLRRRTSTFNTSRVEHLYKNPNFIMEWGNITDSACLYRILQKYQPDEIYHLAAQSHVRVSFDVSEETLDVVGMGTLRLLNAMKDVCPTARFYYAGSSEQYGVSPCPQTGYTELSPMSPASPYACAKMYGFNICRNYRASYGLHISCGILFNHEQPGLRGETFVTRKIAQAAARLPGSKQKLYLGNLEAKRDWGLAEDYVKGMWLMLQQDKPDDYVLATGETHSVQEYLEETFKLAELDVNEHVEIDPRLYRPEEVPYLLGDCSKAKRILGWEPKVKFHELVWRMYEYEFNKEI
jgi:GDPmannose 4,6-dehydratase